MMEDELGGVEPGLGKVGSFSGESDSLRREKNRLKIVELLMHDRRISSSKFRTSAARDSSSSLLESTTSPILTANREKLNALLRIVRYSTSNIKIVDETPRCQRGIQYDK